MRLLMICPTRGGPHKLAALLGGWRQTTQEAGFLALCDPDDPCLPAYRELDCDLRVLDEPMRVTDALNAVASQLATQHDALGFIADSHVPLTPGWDTAMTAALERSGPGVAYANDLFQGENLPTCMAMSSVIIRVLGYMAPPGLQHLYNDDWWKLAGHDLGALTYLPDVLVEHVHPAAGKAPWDPQWLRDNSRGQYAFDQAAYQRFLADRWPGDLARLRESLA